MFNYIDDFGSVKWPINDLQFENLKERFLKTVQKKKSSQFSPPFRNFRLPRTCHRHGKKSQRKLVAGLRTNIKQESAALNKLFKN